MAPIHDADTFAWPEGRRAAVSLSFDDGRASQIENGLPILDEHGVRATFYVVPVPLKERADDWRRAAERGHEIANHTRTHPCSGNFGFARQRPLEDYTLEEMEAELVGASDEIEQVVGARPRTFAYPCGQTFVGRGERTQSYVPLVARHFTAGRSAFDVTHNHPGYCDLAQVTSAGADGLRLGRLVGMVAAALNDGGWLVLFGHDVADGPRQCTAPDVLDTLCGHLKEREEVWVDTVAAVAEYVRRRREG
jgi:peptidoglycan/xylan/chitin deacetylase (PgdA/CDA1 family)